MKLLVSKGLLNVPTISRLVSLSGADECVRPYTTTRRLPAVDEEESSVHLQSTGVDLLSL
jgi:hypothetical protein